MNLCRLNAAMSAALSSNHSPFLWRDSTRCDRSWLSPEVVVDVERSEWCGTLREPAILALAPPHASKPARGAHNPLRSVVVRDSLASLRLEDGDYVNRLDVRFVLIAPCLGQLAFVGFSD